MFYRRLLSSVILWSLVAVTLFVFPPWGQFVLLAALGAIALHEVYAIFEKAGLRSFKTSGLVGGIALMMGGWFFFQKGVMTPAAQDFEACVLMVFVLGVFVRMFPQKNNPTGMATMAATLLGLFYVPWMLNFILKVRLLGGVDGDGKFLVLYLLTVTKLGDSGAYAVGRLIGRHKMIPRISPNKTWEGTGGAVVAAVLASVGTLHWLAASGHDLHINLTHAIILGLLLGVGAIIGDLAESQMKREANVKDSSNLLPGIGGALDLVDSLLFTGPMLYIYLRLVVPVGN